MSTTGIVVIGRNEGERLVRSLQSVVRCNDPAVYVDSGSSDNSIAQARQLHLDVVELDATHPFTAARARNAGAARLLATYPTITALQFVDGDCVLEDSWLARGLDELRRNDRIGAVCGRRRERDPAASLYNAVCDIEWNTPVGLAKSCGGDALIRCAAWHSVGGFDPRLVAGEEPELCVRLRAAGWQVLRVDAPMTVHDAAMTNATQWWRRARRAGYAFAQGAALHGAPPERHWVGECRSNWFWGAALPLFILAAMPPTHGYSTIALAAYPLHGARIYRRMRQRNLSPRDAALWAVACLVGKVPAVLGQAQFAIDRLRHVAATDALTSATASNAP